MIYISLKSVVVMVTLYSRNNSQNYIYTLVTKFKTISFEKETKHCSAPFQTI